MRYLSVCSGIEAATAAWHPLGWSPVAFSEVDTFPSAVLAHHYPGVPNWGDMTKFQEWLDAAVDLLVGGTPCQSFSVAGLRAGLDDPRGSLLLTYLAIARRYRPRWVVWENVPGVLSADDGRAFGSLLGGLGELGYGFAYRVLDAQYFGLAQRRKRVFVVGHLGDWRRAAAVLFERESLSGHPAPRREAGQVAPTVPSRRSAGGGLGTDFAGGNVLFPGTVSSKWAKGTGGPAGDECYNLTLAHALRAEGFDASEDGTGRGTPLVAVDAVAPCLTTNYGKQPDSSDTSAGPMLVPMAFDARQSDVITYGDRSGPLDTDGHSISIAFSAKDHGADAGDIAPTLRAGGHVGSHANGGVMPAVAQHMSVRRLTPRECERLQGFPDDYTLIPYRGKPAADGPRYKALGNSMAVPVMAWIGRRIQMVDELA
jgi:DNA (cytosine-5)-methyltransferase 1